MHECVVCVCVCVPILHCVCTLKGWDQTSKVVKIYITSLSSELSQASKEDIKAKFKEK